MFFKPLKNGYVREAEGSSAFQNETDARAIFRRRRGL